MSYPASTKQARIEGSTEHPDHKLPDEVADIVYELRETEAAADLRLCKALQELPPARPDAKEAVARDFGVDSQTLERLRCLDSHQADETLTPVRIMVASCHTTESTSAKKKTGGTSR